MTAIDLDPIHAFLPCRTPRAWVDWEVTELVLLRRLLARRSSSFMFRKSVLPPVFSW